jgi:hypothetical protein
MAELTFPTGQEVYDALMAQIEPELVSANVAHLDEKYANESEADRKVRYERYTQAFMKYDEAYREWESALHAAVSTYRRDAFRSAETDSRTEETNALAQLERDMETAATAVAK